MDSFEQIEMTRAIGVNDLKTIKEVRILMKRYSPNIVYDHSSKAGDIYHVANIGFKNHCIYNPHGWCLICVAPKRKRHCTQLLKR